MSFASSEFHSNVGPGVYEGKSELKKHKQKKIDIPKEAERFP